MFAKPVVLAASLVAGICCVACDVDEEERELSWAADEADADDAGEDAAEGEQLDDPGAEGELALSNASKPAAAGSGGITVPPAGQQKRCCVNCGDKWSGWWDLGTGNTPRCNTRGPKWCHDHNWNFINAEWFYSCPTG